STLGRSFFFQAEDGIRDFHVTGVQTCALPISPVDKSSRPGLRPGTGGESETRYLTTNTAVAPAKPSANCALNALFTKAVAPVARSEERRVGKGGRSRWLAVHQNERGRERRTTD